jgi:hypothetical protein
MHNTTRTTMSTISQVLDFFFAGGAAGGTGSGGAGLGGTGSGVASSGGIGSGETGSGGVGSDVYAGG